MVSFACAILCNNAYYLRDNIDAYVECSRETKHLITHPGREPDLIRLIIFAAEFRLPCESICCNWCDHWLGRLLLPGVAAPLPPALPPGLTLIIVTRTRENCQKNVLFYYYCQSNLNRKQRTAPFPSLYVKPN